MPKASEIYCPTCKKSTLHLTFVATDKSHIVVRCSICGTRGTLVRVNPPERKKP